MLKFRRLRVTHFPAHRRSRKQKNVAIRSDVNRVNFLPWVGTRVTNRQWINRMAMALNEAGKIRIRRMRILTFKIRRMRMRIG